MRQIEKPEVATRAVDKKNLWFNIRESRLLYMFHRNLITMNEYEAGSRFTSVMKLFCWQNFGIIEIANQLNITERKASNFVHEGLRALSIYYGFEKVRNTIRGQGTKVKRPKVS